MANNFSEENLAALFKSIEITKQDAKFNEDDPPRGIFNPERMDTLKVALLCFDHKSAFDEILSIESNRDILRKELKYILKAFLLESNVPNKTLLKALLKKYEIHTPLCPMLNENQIALLTELEIDTALLPRKNISSILKITHLFPDIVYSIQKKDVNSQIQLPPLIDIYKKFNSLHFNVGILGLLPKGKKYGGFVKALIHMQMNVLHSTGLEECLAILRSSYNSPIVPHYKREKWFAKLEISESDCLAWSKIFDSIFPEHNDIHKYFGQTA